MAIFLIFIHSDRTITAGLSAILMVLGLMLTTACDEQKDIQRPKGVVTSASPEATAAGIEILNRGGNAVDAMVAVSFALGVTEPAMSGLGGGCQILLAQPGDTPIMINGTTLSPATTPIAMDTDTLTYHRRSTIPSSVKATYYTWQKYGSGRVSWADLLQPAIKYAEQGFPIGDFRSKVYQRYGAKILSSPHDVGPWLMPDGSIPQEGDTLRQPLLAKTLRRLAQGGSDAYYRGEIAEEIAQDMRNKGGWITLEDLADFPDPQVRPAISTDFQGYKIYTAAPPTGGWTMLLALNLLQQLTDNGGNETERLALLQALRLAHEDRALRPVLDIADSDSLIAEKLSHDYATRLLANLEVGEASKLDSSSGETTHFSVVDDTGMAVAYTASINAYFGALAASPKLGFLYNTYMDDFVFGQPDHPWSIGPAKMAYSSMSPTIIQKDGKTVLVLGSPGSARIISAVTQVIASWIDTQDIIETVAQPRYHVSNGKVYIENITDSTEIKDWISANNHQWGAFRNDLEKNEKNAYFGGVHAISYQNGQWVGVADPRRDGSALATANE
ncbi:MAG: gamma-glutamyltransferase [Cyclobacteriaceae bacterium]